MFMDGYDDKVALDNHYYQAWYDKINTTQAFCDEYETSMAILDDSKYEVWIGEWSLATDTCAMWLGGFNDFLIPYWEHPGSERKNFTESQMTCVWNDCPQSYLPEPLNIDFDRTSPIMGPFGDQRESSCIHNGKCSQDSAFFNST